MSYNLYFQHLQTYNEAITHKVLAGKMSKDRYETLWGKLVEWQNYARQVL